MSECLWHLYDADMADDTDSAMVRREKDGRPFRIGTPAEVAWIESGTASGRTITAAIPPVFDAYATIIVPEGEGEGLRLRHDRAVLTLLEAGSADQAWWLGCPARRGRCPARSPGFLTQQISRGLNHTDGLTSSDQWLAFASSGWKKRGC
jgi:hypothetical protein